MFTASIWIPGKVGQRTGQQSGLDLTGHRHLFFQLLLGHFFLVEAGILDLQGDLAGDDGQQLQLVDLVFLFTAAVRQGHQSDQPAMGDHGDQQLHPVFNQQGLFAETGLQGGLFPGDGLATFQLLGFLGVGPVGLAMAGQGGGQGRQVQFLGIAWSSSSGRRGSWGRSPARLP